MTGTAQIRLPGDINPHLVGLAGKEMVRRAIQAIRKQRLIFETTQKGDRPDGRPDLLTTADKAAQAIYVKLITECFPGFGIVAEEDHLTISCTIPDHDVYFTVDPLDGTNAFIRRQSHGIGTMLALVCDGVIVAAWIGDVMTGEIYYYRPGSDRVHRLFGFDEAETLAIDPKRPLSDQYALLRRLPENSDLMTEEMAQKKGGLFRDVEVGGGSLGIGCARLWKGEVGAIVLDPVAKAMPWDYCPVIGISQKLGFVFLNMDRLDYGPFTIEPDKKPVERPFELLIVHESRLPEIMNWFRTLKA